jgi:hypothetical protein
LTPLKNYDILYAVFVTAWVFGRRKPRKKPKAFCGKGGVAERARLSGVFQPENERSAANSAALGGANPAKSQKLFAEKAESRSV